MTQQAERQAVIEEAMTWLRTPYHHHARIKGVGVDCAQLPIAVYSVVGLIEAPSPAYVHDWHLHRGEELFVDWVLRYAREIDRLAIQPGDLGLWRYGRTHSHGAIILPNDQVVHAVLGQGVELGDLARDNDLMPEALGGRKARFFTLWGMTDGR